MPEKGILITGASAEDKGRRTTKPIQQCGTLKDTIQTLSKTHLEDSLSPHTLKLIDDTWEAKSLI